MINKMNFKRYLCDDNMIKEVLDMDYDIIKEYENIYIVHEKGGGEDDVYVLYNDEKKLYGSSVIDLFEIWDIWDDLQPISEEKFKEALKRAL
uniref:Uncharacterized protein n=1 Tax=Siphoviridae sp. ctoiA13 TaxID=2826462 RepID=A0A8S5QYN2_9CAUD|nr:MAG TPA: hypothetical protein [Siphoviridae sp. ctoiA13]